MNGKQNSTILIYNTKGQKVATVATSKESMGLGKIVWNGTNNNGVLLGSGIYLYKYVELDKIHSRGKIVIIRE